MKIVILNGSPKAKSSASENIINYLTTALGTRNNCILLNALKTKKEDFMNVVKETNAIVIVFPLYVDGLPSHLLRFLDGVKDDLKKISGDNMTVYAVVNNGFYDAHQNALAMDMIRNFCSASGLTYGQSLGIGAGGMVGDGMKIGQEPLKKIGVALTVFSDNIKDQSKSDDIFVHPNIPRFLYKTFGNHNWKVVAKKNGLQVKYLYAKR